MSVAVIMLVKDEADILRQNIDHLLHHVDAIYVADNCSTDGTREILSMAQEVTGGRVRVWDDREKAYFQDRKMTASARQAHAEGYDWIVPVDADEWWYAPSGARLGDALDSLTASPHVRMVEASILNHVATSLDNPADENPITRMGYRLREVGRLPKVAMRGSPDMHISMGNHSGWYDNDNDRQPFVKGLLEIRHFPYRSEGHFVRKAVNGYAAYKETNYPEDVGGHWRAYGRMIEEQGEQAGRDWFNAHFFYDSPAEDPLLVYDPAPL